jgi:hypothetical protein
MPAGVWEQVKLEMALDHVLSLAPDVGVRRDWSNETIIGWSDGQNEYQCHFRNGMLVQKLHLPPDGGAAVIEQDVDDPFAKDQGW